MKTKLIVLTMMAVGAGANVFAQEFDDMYFTSKDRAKSNQNVREAVVLASAKQKGENTQTINPSDSYSARNENPDYVAGSKVGSNAPQQSPSYFNSTYVPSVNQNQYNCNCNTGYNNSYAYGNPYYNSYGAYGFGSPYSSFYPYGYGYGYSPYSYGMGMYPSMSLGMGYGMGYGMYSMWGSPSSMSFWNSYYGMGSYYGYGYPYYGYGMGSYYYPSSYYTANNYSPDNTGYATGRRPSRGGALTQSSYYNSTSRSSNAVVDANGRTRGAAAHSQYYQSGWRGNSPGNNGGGHVSTGGRTSSFWGSGNSNSGWNNSNSGWGSRGSSSWGNSGSGFGSRSGGFSGGGFSGGGGGHVGGGSGGGHSGGGGRGRH